VLRLLLVSSLLLPGCNPGRAITTREDAIAIVRAVIAEEMSYNGEDIRYIPCVVPQIKETTFDGLRNHQAAARQLIARFPADRSLRQEYEKPLLYEWERPSTYKGGASIRRSEATTLSAAVAAILAEGRSQHSISSIAAEWLSPPYRLCRPTDKSRLLILSSPAIRDDLAFVEVELNCPTCGYGIIHALHWNGVRWVIIAQATLWMS
jgi:hypothetical protein